MILRHRHKKGGWGRDIHLSRRQCPTPGDSIIGASKGVSDCSPPVASVYLVAESGTAGGAVEI